MSVKSIKYIAEGEKRGRGKFPGIRDIGGYICGESEFGERTNMRSRKASSIVQSKQIRGKSLYCFSRKLAVSQWVSSGEGYEQITKKHHVWAGL